MKDNQAEDMKDDNDKEHSTPLSTERLSLSGVGRSSPSCRICQSSRRSVQELGELLDSPCHCRGTLGFVHKHCIETWLRVRKQDTCELCHFKFETRWRYKPFREWQFIQVFEMLNSNEKGVLMLGFVNFLLFILEIPFLYYIFKMNSKYFADHINSSDESQDNSSGVIALLLTLLLFFSMVLFASSIIFIVFGFKMLRKVLGYNREVILIIPKRRLEESMEEEHVV
ncbi:hypothetical protein pdam_00003542 [Pocillopora damicornis]|uniref:RING-CH-type domain-containing protein n=1 Tax=Pocillopora damicornis TaxID=46731 RepID=A0A3M6V6D5_POCDA|nr:hypothetical protein pdam_00003542 [Pocillopora damicornis]